MPDSGCPKCVGWSEGEFEFNWAAAHEGMPDFQPFLRGIEPFEGMEDKQPVYSCAACGALWYLRGEMMCSTPTGGQDQLVA